MPRRNGNAERDSEKRWRTRRERKRKGTARQSVKDKKRKE